MKILMPCLVLCALIAAIALKAPVHLPQELPTALIAGYELSYLGFPAQPDAWFSVVHASNNSFHAWRLAPLLSTLSFRLGTSPQQQTCIYFFALFIVLAAGAYLHFRRLGSTSLESSSLAGLLLLALLAFAGADLLLFSCLAGLPWLLLLLRSTSSTRARQLGTLGVASWLALSAHIFAPCLALFALAQSTLRRSSLIIVLAPALLAAFLTPFPSIPSYPPYAALVADDGIAGTIRPHFASDVSIQIVDRAQLRAAALPMLGLLALLSLMLLRRREQYAAAALALLAALSIDILLPESFAQLGPLAVITRLLPGLYFTSLIPVATALCLYSVVACVAQTQGHYQRTAASLFLLLLVFVNPDRGVLQAPQALLPVQQLADNSEALQRLISPSYALVRNHGSWLLSERFSFLTSQAFASIAPLLSSLEGFPNNKPEALKRAIDGDRNTRWNAGSAGQAGQEWLELHFNQPLALEGVELSTGNFRTDFPRGLQLTNCSGTHAVAWSLSANPWLGALALTDQGFPYHRGQEDTRIVFPETLRTDCLRISQIAKEPVFDWSVAEVRGLIAAR